MKLKIGNIIKDRRRAADMTQDELAARLGVSSQAVSRWENGVAYPDLELLPILAGMFGITVDELLGERREDRLEMYWKEADAVDNSEDFETFSSIFRRAFAEFPNEFIFGRQLCVNLSLLCWDKPYMREEIIPEIRRVGSDILERCTDAEIRADVIECLTVWEDDDKLESVLDRFVPISSTTNRRELLSLRYEALRDEEKHYAITLYERIDTLKRYVIGMPIDPKREFDYKHTAEFILDKLRFLNAIVGIDNETRKLHPVSGDSVPDLWTDDRIRLGLGVSCRLACLGRKDEALSMIEDITCLIENLFTLKIGDVLSYRTDESGLWDKVVSKKEKGEYGNVIIANTSEENIAKLNDLHLLMTTEVRFDAKFYIDALETWRDFDPIRKHPRYYVYIERIKSTVGFNDSK